MVPAKPLAGRVVDRFGQRAAAPFLAAPGVVLFVLAGDQVTSSLAPTGGGLTSRGGDRRLLDTSVWYGEADVVVGGTGS